MKKKNYKYAIVFDRRLNRVLFIKLKPEDFPDEELEDYEMEEVLYSYESEYKFDLTYCDWMLVKELKMEMIGFDHEVIGIK